MELPNINKKTLIRNTLNLNKPKASKIHSNKIIKTTLPQISNLSARYIRNKNRSILFNSEDDKNHNSSYLKTMKSTERNEYKERLNNVFKDKGKGVEKFVRNLNFISYSIDDYRKLYNERLNFLSGLGPNIRTIEWEKNASKRKNMKDYSDLRNKENIRKLIYNTEKKRDREQEELARKIMELNRKIGSNVKID